MVLCSHFWQEEQHVTFNISTVLEKKRKSCCCQPEASSADRASDTALVYLPAWPHAGQPYPALSPSARFTSVFSSWGAEQMQPKQITQAILRCILPCGLHPSFYRNIIATLKFAASFPVNPLHPTTAVWRSPLPFQASDGEHG